jgi:N-acetyl-gamma-glutamyl-phosphate reductase
MPREDLQVLITPTDSGLTVTLVGEAHFDFDASDDYIHDILGHKPDQVTVDGSRLTFISSTGIYFLLSLRRAIRDAGGTVRLCGLRPLVEAGWISESTSVVCDCKSGASGAGKDPRRELHFVEVDENFKAYNLFSHRHTPEILEHTGLPEDRVVFSTHLLPLARGILSTIYVTLAESQTGESIEALYRKFYAGRHMVRIWPAETLPELQHVAHTNFCDIGFALDKSGRRLVIVSCLDNLGKGAAGQAVQNFNHMLGIEEHTALQ